ncbi:IS5 family transposase [Streptomyces sp. JV185]|nr:IS5 family transposase [Streptomyces sp. JV185]MEE1772469.1 IS5 family transposase [Streptomyces sp. JV185]
MTRVQLTDAERELIAPYLPIGEYGPYPERLRQQFEGVIRRFRSGGQWREMPQESGTWSTMHNRFRLCGVTPTSGGCDEQIEQDAEDDPEREERRRIRRRRELRLKAALLGRSRDGQTSKVRLAADQKCRPRAFVLTAGQAVDSPQFVPVPGRIGVRGPVGRPRTRPDAVAGDKAYSSRGNRAQLRRRGIRAVIPETRDHASNRKKRGSRDSRPLRHDADLHKERNTVECLINKLKAWRGIATRYDKTPDSYLAGLHLRASMI